MSGKLHNEEFKIEAVRQVTDRGYKVSESAGKLSRQCGGGKFLPAVKRERIKRRIYPDRQTARADRFDYIGMFYNRQCEHGNNDMLSPVEYARRYFMKRASV